MASGATIVVYSTSSTTSSLWAVSFIRRPGLKTSKLPFLPYSGHLCQNVKIYDRLLQSPAMVENPQQNLIIVDDKRTLTASSTPDHGTGTIHVNKTQVGVNIRPGNVTSATDVISSEALGTESKNQRRTRYLVSKVPFSGLQELHTILLNLRPADNTAQHLEQYELKYHKLTEKGTSFLVTSLSRKGKVHVAIDIWEWACKTCQRLPLTAYNSLLAALVKSSMDVKALTVYESMKQTKLVPSMYTYTLVIRATSKCQGWESAYRLFNNMLSKEIHNPNVFVYNALISAYGRAKKWNRALQIWDKMKQVGCKENMGTCCLLISTFVGCRQFEPALEVFYRVIQRGWRPTDSMYKGLICVSAHEGRWMLALEFFHEMVASGASPSLLACNSLINSIGKAGQWNLAFQVYNWMRANGLCPDAYTCNAVLNAFMNAGEYEQGVQFFVNMKESGLHLDREVYNVALVAYQKLRDWKGALGLLKEMDARGVQPDVMSYGIAITACEAGGQTSLALMVYEHMKNVRCTPNTYVVAALIRICKRQSLWHIARKIFEESCRAGIEPNIYVYNALIDVFYKCKQVTLAKNLMKQMHIKGCKPDSVTVYLKKKYYSRKRFLI